MAVRPVRGFVVRKPLFKMNSRISDAIEERAHRRRRGRKASKGSRPERPIAHPRLHPLLLESCQWNHPNTIASPGVGVLNLPESLQEPRTNHRTRSARVLAAKSNAMGISMDDPRRVASKGGNLARNVTMTSLSGRTRASATPRDEPASGR